MENAGRWLATERGAFDAEQQEVQAVPRESFPLAERLSDEELVMLYEFRAQLSR